MDENAFGGWALSRSRRGAIDAPTDLIPYQLGRRYPLSIPNPIPVKTFGISVSVPTSVFPV